MPNIYKMDITELQQLARRDANDNFNTPMLTKYWLMDAIKCVELGISPAQSIAYALQSGSVDITQVTHYFDEKLEA